MFGDQSLDWSRAKLGCCGSLYCFKENARHVLVQRDVYVCSHNKRLTKIYSYKSKQAMQSKPGSPTLSRIPNRLLLARQCFFPRRSLLPIIVSIAMRNIRVLMMLNEADLLPWGNDVEDNGAGPRCTAHWSLANSYVSTGTCWQALKPDSVVEIFHTFLTL